MRRRTILKKMSQAGLGIFVSNPLAKLYAALLSNEASYQNLNEGSSAIRNYLQINLYGAPSRFGFDHLLKPYDDNRFVPYKFIANKVTGQNPENLCDVQFAYSTVKHFGLNVPVQWSQMLPTIGEGEKAMAELFQNALMIRGCRLDFSGHPLNGMQQVAPVPGGLSIHGIIADASKVLFPSISVGANPVSRSYKSESALLTEIPYNEPNYVDYILQPFLLKQKESFFKEPDLDRQAESLAKLYPDNLKNIAQIKTKAMKNMRGQIDGFMSQYAAMVAKYELLINKSITSYRSTFNVKCPVLPLKISGKFNSAKEVLGPFTIMERLYLESNPLTFLLSGKLQYWAQEFAISEFLLVNNLSQSILISAPSPDIGYLMTECQATDKVQLENIDLVYQEMQKMTSLDFKLNSENFVNGIRKVIKDPRENFGMDTHGTGLVYEILGNEVFFRMLSTCLLELIKTLKAKKLFDQTVIHIASEFDRVPLSDGSGSDHNALANPTCIISGCIKEPMVIGNIYSGSLELNKENYFGTVGNGAPVKEIDTSIKIGHVSSTISKLVGVKSIIPRQPSLVDFKDGNVVSLVEKPRNVEGVQ